MKKLVLSSLLFLLVIAAAFVVLIAISNTPMPAKTSSPSLKVPKRPKDNVVLLKWLQSSKLSRNATAGPKGPVWKKMVDDLNAGRAFSQPTKVAALLKSLGSELKGFSKAILSDKGCIPSQDYKTVDAPAQFSYIPWIYGVRGVMATLLLEMQQGKSVDNAQKAAEKLLKLQEKIYFYEQTCGANLLGTMVLVAGIPPVMAGMLALLKSPSVSLATKKRAAGWLRKWATRKESISTAFRWEARFMLRMIKQMEKGKKSASGRTMPIPVKYAWPFYDPKETKHLTKELWRCVLRRNQLPIHLQETYPPCPIERYLKAVKKQPTWKKPFRYNSVGKILLSIGIPSYRRFAVKMQQSICFSAAVYTRWQRSLSKEERAQLSAALLKEVPNPFTNRAFPTLGSTVCGAPKGWKRSLAGLSLPVLPKAAAANKPAQPPVKRP